MIAITRTPSCYTGHALSRKALTTRWSDARTCINDTPDELDHRPDIVRLALTSCSVIGYSKPAVKSDGYGSDRTV